jgi:hypothetical protein
MKKLMLVFIVFLLYSLAVAFMDDAGSVSASWTASDTMLYSLLILGAGFFLLGLLWVVVRFWGQP